MVEGAAEADAAVERVRRHHRGLIYKGEPQLKAHVMARALFKREGYERLTKDSVRTHYQQQQHCAIQCFAISRDSVHSAPRQ